MDFDVFEIHQGYFVIRHGSPGIDLNLMVMSNTKHKDCVVALKLDRKPAL